MTQTIAGNGNENITSSGDNIGAIDPITASVIQGALETIAIEMGHKLMRMAYSSIIRESEDFGAAIVDAKCRQLCESNNRRRCNRAPSPATSRAS